MTRAFVLVLGYLAYSSTALDTEPCHPVPAEAARAYRDWGHQQSPRLEFQSCAAECAKGLRLCRFSDADGNAHLATCNGRRRGAPCRLARK